MKGKAKRYSNAGHPSVFTKETELFMVQHVSCLREWGYSFHIIDVRMFAKQVLCEEGRHVPRGVARIWKRGGGYFERVRSVQTTLTRIFIDLESV